MCFLRFSFCLWVASVNPVNRPGEGLTVLVTQPGENTGIQSWATRLPPGNYLSQALRLMPVIPVPRRLRQENPYKFKVMHRVLHSEFQDEIE